MLIRQQLCHAGLRSGISCLCKGQQITHQMRDDALFGLISLLVLIELRFEKTYHVFVVNSY